MHNLSGLISEFDRKLLTRLFDSFKEYVQGKLPVKVTVFVNIHMILAVKKKLFTDIYIYLSNGLFRPHFCQNF